jgi:hypothetical protein
MTHEDWSDGPIADGASSHRGINEEFFQRAPSATPREHSAEWNKVQGQPTSGADWGSARKTGTGAAIVRTLLVNWGW